MHVKTFAILLCLLPACIDGADSGADCLELGCADGSYCDASSGLCELNCVEGECGDGYCDADSGQCASSCLEAGCGDGKACDPVSHACLTTCLETGCDSATWCNEQTGLCETDIVIPDANLESCLRLYLNKREGALTVTDAAGLDYLDCIDSNIVDLTGMEHFVNLTKLTLWENRIVNVAPLGALTRLESLQLGNNDIDNIYYIGELTSLTRLGLAHNEIFLAAPLANLTKLRWLSLDGNRISDAAPLLGLTQLLWLTIENNELDIPEELDALEAVGVEVYKQSAGNGIDISGLDGELRVDVDRLYANARLTHVTTADGEVRFEYRLGDRDLRVIKEYPGRIYEQDGELRYEVPGFDVAIGAVEADGLRLCAGDYAGICQFSLGKKNPIGLEGGHQLVGNGEPVITASLRLEVNRPLFVAPAFVYGETFRWLEPYALASPNQQDAGSCNYMANTGAMELLINQHTPLNDIVYDGDTDLSERYLMNASSYAPSSVVGYHIVDLVYTYGYHGGAMLSRDYPFAAGYVRETAGGSIVAAESGESGAYFSCSYSWIDDLPADWQEQLVKTPDADRGLIFIDPDLDSNSIWNVGIMNDDVINRIKYELLTKRAPVIVVYNHYLYWHATIVVGYDDNAYAGNCPMVMSSVDYFKEQGHDYAAAKVEEAIDKQGGCSTTGIFYVRDSIYSGENGDPIFSYSDEYNYTEPYSARIVEHSYDWAKYLGNHAYTVHRK